VHGVADDLPVPDLAPLEVEVAVHVQEGPGGHLPRIFDLAAGDPGLRELQPTAVNVNGPTRHREGNQDGSGPRSARLPDIAGVGHRPGEADPGRGTRSDDGLVIPHNPERSLVLQLSPSTKGKDRAPEKRERPRLDDKSGPVSELERWQER